MPYTSDEIKKQLDDAIKKLQISAENAAQEKRISGGSAATRRNAQNQSGQGSTNARQSTAAERQSSVAQQRSTAAGQGVSVQQRSIAARPDDTVQQGVAAARPDNSMQQSAAAAESPDSAVQRSAAAENPGAAVQRRSEATGLGAESQLSAAGTAQAQRIAAAQPSATAQPQQRAATATGTATRERTAAPEPSAAAQRSLAQTQPGLPAAPQRNVSTQLNRPAANVRPASGEAVRDFKISPSGVLTELSSARSATRADYDTGPSDFFIHFDFDRVYQDVPDEKPFRLRREKRIGLMGGLLYAVFVICLSLVLASLAWLAATDVLGFGAVDELVNITITRGFTLDEIVDTLYDAGLIKYKFLFNFYAEYSNAKDKISVGSYVLNKNFDYRALVYGMTAQSRLLIETTVTIPEGYTLAEIFTRLEDNGVCHSEDLWETATNYDYSHGFLDKSTLGDRYRLEGYLFPETYNFFLDSSPVQVINRFLNEFENRYTDLHAERAESLGYSLNEILTIASMIEKEAGSDEERSRIAAVIYNRLNNSSDFPYLNIDATIYYAMAETGRPFSTSLDSPYNTYLHSGLPPGPIANPGIESIQAALYPDSTNEYYYALNKQGTHKFSRTLAEHEAFLASPEYFWN